MESNRRNNSKIKKGLTKTNKCSKVKPTKKRSSDMTLENLNTLPNFDIVEKTGPSWFDKAIENIEAGKEPFAE